MQESELFQIIVEKMGTEALFLTSSLSVCCNIAGNNNENLHLVSDL